MSMKYIYKRMHKMDTDYLINNKNITSTPTTQTKTQKNIDILKAL